MSWQWQKTWGVTVTSCDPLPYYVTVARLRFPNRHPLLHNEELGPGLAAFLHGGSAGGPFGSLAPATSIKLV
jgi:hypothetical protein